jgi:hypothetical protein
MKIDVDKLTNKLVLTYHEVEEFDPYILVKHEQAFQVLNPEDYINIETNGFIPIEVSAYICEVSKWCCGIILKINDDIKSYNYLNDLISKDNLTKLYLDYRGEIFEDDVGGIDGNISRED